MMSRMLLLLLLSLYFLFEKIIFFLVSSVVEKGGCFFESRFNSFLSLRAMSLTKRAENGFQSGNQLTKQGAVAAATFIAADAAHQGFVLVSVVAVLPSHRIYATSPDRLPSKHANSLHDHSPPLKIDLHLHFCLQ